MQDNFSSLDPYLQDYTAKSQKAAGAASYATTLPDLLTKTLNEKLSTSPVIGERSTAASNFLRELGAAPASVLPQNMGGVVLNPNEQAAIISGRRATALTPLMTANQRYDLLSGQIPDIVGAASRSAQSQAQLAQSEAGIAGETYKTLLDRLAKGQQMDWEKYKFGKELSLKERALAQKGASGNKISAQEAVKLAAAQGGISEVKRLMGEFAKMPKGSTGFGAGAAALLQRFGIQVPGLYTPGVSKASTDISSMNIKLFDIAGKALTKPETSVLNGLKLLQTDSPLVIQNKLQGWSSLFENAQQQAYSTILLSRSTLGDDSDFNMDDWEIVQ